MTTAAEASRVDVRFFTLDRDDAECATYCASLSASERARAGRFRSPHDGRRFAIARGILRVALSHRTGIAAAALDIVEEAHGKPILRGAGEIHFSTSRTARVVALAFAGEPVGIDLVASESGPLLASMASDVCSPAELASLGAPDDGRFGTRLAMLWARKEALLKATGEGLAHLPSGLHIGCAAGLSSDGCVIVRGRRPWRIRDISAPPLHHAAIAQAVR